MVKSKVAVALLMCSRLTGGWIERLNSSTLCLTSAEFSMIHQRCGSICAALKVSCHNCLTSGMKALKIEFRSRESGVRVQEALPEMKRWATLPL